MHKQTTIISRFRFIFVRRRRVLHPVFRIPYSSIIASYKNCRNHPTRRTGVLLVILLHFSKLWTKVLTFDFSASVPRRCSLSPQLRKGLPQIYLPSPPAPEFTPVDTTSVYSALTSSLPNFCLRFRPHHLSSNTRITAGPNMAVCLVPNTLPLRWPQHGFV